MPEQVQPLHDLRRDRLGVTRSGRPPTATTPTGLTRSRHASQPARDVHRRGVLARRCEVTVIDADVSMNKQTGIRFGASYSLTRGFPVRAVTRQSIARIGSPGWRKRDCTYSSPDPRNGPVGP